MCSYEWNGRQADCSTLSKVESLSSAGKFYDSNILRPGRNAFVW